MNENEASLKEGNTKRRRGGGTSCCVPNCNNNTRKHQNLSFHKFPKDKRLRSAWIHWIGRKDFSPNDHHRVCSEHFPDGKKSYLNNIPTVTPKLIKPSQSKPRSTFKCRQRIPFTELTNTASKMNNEDVSCDGEKNVVDTETPDDIIKRLQSEIDRLKEEHEKEVMNYRRELNRSRFSVERFKDSDDDFQFYTGFQNYSKFKSFMDFLSPTCHKLRYIGANNGALLTEDQQKRGRKRCLSVEEELFMVLARLRCGLFERDLANRYDISVSQVSSIWITWISFLHQRLRAVPIWPSRVLVNKNMPESVKEHYPNTRVIIDCTEIFIEMPSSPATQSATFSNYKHHNTAKGLVGISPAGTITFVSELYAGRTSDKEIANDCGIFKLLETGDEIMADKGFNIEDDLPEGVLLNRPPFLSDQKQLSQEDEVKTRRIARERIHVERAIEKIKNFRILQQTIPLSMAADINKIWGICSYLTLFFKPTFSCYC